MNEIGSYKAKGEVVVKDHEMVVWFMIKYEDRENAGQTGKWRDLVFESTYFQPDGIQGRWYYDNYEGDAEFSGKWDLKNIFENDGMVQNGMGTNILSTDN